MDVKHCRLKRLRGHLQAKKNLIFPFNWHSLNEIEVGISGVTLGDRRPMTPVPGIAWTNARDQQSTQCPVNDLASWWVFCWHIGQTIQVADWFLHNCSQPGHTIVLLAYCALKLADYSQNLLISIVKYGCHEASKVCFDVFIVVSLKNLLNQQQNVHDSRCHDGFVTSL